jgi:hypothetical protein
LPASERQAVPEYDLPVFSGLVVVQVIATIMAVLINGFGGMSGGTCVPDATCDPALTNFAALLTPAGAVVVFVATIVVGIALRRLGIRTWWVPLASIAIMAAVCLVAASLLASAVQGPLFP